MINMFSKKIGLFSCDIRGTDQAVMFGHVHPPKKGILSLIGKIILQCCFFSTTFQLLL